jgi:hypothetical protein
MALLTLALIAGACGGNKSPESSGAPGTEGGSPPTAAGGPIEWGLDTVWAAARLPAGEAAKRTVTLQLAPNGDARMTSDYPDRGPGTDVGWWSARNDTLAIQFATIQGMASGTTSTWIVRGLNLAPLVYNKEEWGPDGLAFQVRPRAGP